ncbi:glycosyltransferase family 2 protein [Clostridium tyrobutyricum]|uniref:glycosyltransferase family 2 protein n=1 Tax=Clostridium tyrobutyricum TaxID=1519 RepID=UPI00030DB4DD|nr:glycosyltransferase family 2 protein [Clostridium tyrobutyricum]MEA5007114.1 glycosyltransferase family 2 protein [Clostridium tyrobutyricum]
MNDLVSVVIPMYNSEKYIKSTIQSVLNQTYDNIEIIIIDDGSLDRSAFVVKEIMSKYGNKKIYYFYQKNLGVSCARNNGIKKSNGKYIAFIDSDDLWLETKIEKQIKVMTKYHINACYCGFSDFYQKENLIKERKMKFPEGKILYDFLKDNVWCWTGTWIINKSFINDNKIVFSEDCSWGEDFEFFIKISTLTEVCCVPEYLALYRIREKSLTTSSSLLSHSDDIYVWINLDEWIKKNFHKLIYKDIQKIHKLIYEFRIPFSLINYTYAFIKQASEKDIIKNINLIDKKVNNKYIEYLRLNYGIKVIKLYVKLLLIRFKLYRYKLSIDKNLK